MTTAERFKTDGTYFGEYEIAGIPCTVAYIKKFRWRWMATQLNTFIIVGETDQKIDLRTIDLFSALAFQFALNNNRGWPRGFQAGVGSVAILKGPEIDQAAGAFVSNLTRKHWSAFEIPVLYNTTHKQTIRFANTPLWGAIYFPYFSKLIGGITAGFK